MDDDDVDDIDLTGVYFEGDPAVDSTRRHLERVLRQPESARASRRWRWFAWALAGGSAWTLWRIWRSVPRRLRDV